MSKDKFKALSARGGGLFDEKITELRNDRKPDIDEAKVHTFRIKQSNIEKLKNYVHQQKFVGFPYISQGEVIDEALERFFESVGQISERPEELKKKERKRTGRRKKEQSDFEL
ncbi:hypothetical protein RT717_00960 [Imperialibacter roseus]|uniref:Mobilization protein n=1 Tax=Imperialibacter roseus TaxID=1324217 RepID=A0ABZ0IQB9_9BACT|nr:hypothetical protein [Imperialibacter roseus]WOK07189.1 hypothetical protein RT717_00960 [Imperialibacter roseus]